MTAKHRSVSLDMCVKADDVRRNAENVHLQWSMPFSFMNRRTSIWQSFLERNWHFWAFV